MLRTNTLTNEEYGFLTETLPMGNPELHLRAGSSCYAEGYIDDFGFVTPKGRKALEDFKRNTKASLPYGVALD